MLQREAGAKKYAKRQSKQQIGIALTLPAIVVMLATVVYPLIWALKISFLSSNSILTGKNEFVGFSNYLNVLASDEFSNAMVNTLAFVVVTVVMELLIGLLISVTLNRRLRGNKIFAMLFSLPLMMAPIVAGFIWRWLFADQYGIINYLLSFLGIENHLWFATPFWAKSSVLIANLWQTTPFVILVLYAALSNIPDEINEAASIDGAGGFGLFRRITLPLLKPAILLVLVIRIADAFRIYDLVYILTGGGPGNATNVLNTFIYRKSFSDFQFGQGSAASIIITLIIMVVSYFSFRLMRPGRGNAE